MTPLQWLMAVTTTPEISGRAVQVANYLMLVRRNRKTGQCNPSRGRMASDLKLSEDTVKRAIAQLVEKGWIKVEHGPHRTSPRSYRFLNTAGEEVSLDESTGAVKRETRAQKCPDDSRQKCAEVIPLRGNFAPDYRADLPPHIVNLSSEPYAGARERAAPHLREFIRPGSAEAVEWEHWLAKKRYPPLAELRRLHDERGICLPYRRPPSERDAVAHMVVAERVIEWALEPVAQAQKQGGWHATG